MSKLQHLCNMIHYLAMKMNVALLHTHAHTKAHKQREQKYYSVSKYNKITILSKRLQRKEVAAAEFQKSIRQTAH